MIQGEVFERFSAGLAAEAAGDRDLAVRMYEEALSIDARFAPAHINLGTIFFHMHHYASAEDAYRKAVEADPEYTMAFFNLGNVLDEVHRYGEAVEAYSKALALDPHYADAYYNLARVYELTNDKPGALRCWRAYLQLDGDSEWSDAARSHVAKMIEGGIA